MTNLESRSISLGRFRVPLPGVLAAVLALAGVVALLVAAGAQHHAPQPSRLARTAPVGPATTSPAPVVTTTPRPAATSRARSRSAPVTHPVTSIHDGYPSLAPGNGSLRLPASRPVHLTIPAIGVSTSVMLLGLNPDGSAEVPPLSRVSVAGWYQYSASPGSGGSAVMLGHIDSAAYGAGVFYRLGALQPGEEIDVARADGRTAVFRADRVAEYPKSSFPTSLVYGATGYSSLRLVTCGGSFDAQTSNYLDNIVAFASLVRVRG